MMTKILNISYRGCLGNISAFPCRAWERAGSLNERTLRYKLHEDQQGFTLIEMLIAVALALIILSGVYEVFTSQQKAYSTQDQVVEMQQNARVAMDMMTREIRLAGYIAEQWTTDATPTGDVSVGGYTTDGSADDIEDINTNDLTFEGDVDGNSQTDTVRYSLSGNNLVREVCEWDGSTSTWCVSSSAQPLAENITNLTFAYYDSNGVVTATRSNIRLVKVSLTARTAREDAGYTHPVNSDGYRTRTLTAYVRPRNLGL